MARRDSLSPLSELRDERTADTNSRQSGIAKGQQVGRAIDTAIGARTSGPILVNLRGTRMDRHAATRRLRRLSEAAGVRIARPHPHMLRHTFVTTMLDAGVDLRDVQIAARHADPRTTMRRAGPPEP